VWHEVEHPLDVCMATNGAYSKLHRAWQEKHLTSFLQQCDFNVCVVITPSPVSLCNLVHYLYLGATLNYVTVSWNRNFSLPMHILRQMFCVVTTSDIPTSNPMSKLDLKN
jgi:hypothetical protein